MTTFQTVEFKGFPGGLDVAAASGATGTNKARSFLNVGNDADGCITFAGGWRQLIAAGLISNVTGIHDYDNGTVRHLFITTNSDIFTYDEGTSTLTNISTIGCTEPTFAQIEDNLYFTGYDVLGDNAGMLHVYNPALVLKIRVAGITNPPTADVVLTTSIAGVGPIVGDITYAFTVTDERGVESAPTGVSAVIATGTTGQSVEFLTWSSDFVDYLTDILGEQDDPNDVRVNVYRYGNNIGTLRRVFSFQPVITGANTIEDADTSSNVEDTVRDADVSFVEPQIDATPPPVGLIDILHIHNRLFGITENNLWFSRDGEYEQFGQDDNGVDDDGGFIRPDNNLADDFMCLASTGGIIIIGRRLSITSVYGNRFDQFAFDKRSNKGVASKYAMKRCDNTVMWVGSDAKVYALGDADSRPVWKPIHPYLRNVVEAGATSTIKTEFHDGKFILSAPMADALTHIALGFDIEDGTWAEFSGSHLRGTYYLSRRRPDNDAPELLVARSGGGIFGDFNIVVPEGNYKPINVKSDRIPFDEERSKGRIIEVLVVGEFEEDETDPLTLTIRTGSLAGQSVERVMVNTDGLLLRITRLPPKLVGNWLEFELTGSVRSMRIDAITFGFIRLRAGSTTDE